MIAGIAWFGRCTADLVHIHAVGADAVEYEFVEVMELVLPDLTCRTGNGVEYF